jgi:hypothetical protein
MNELGEHGPATAAAFAKSQSIHTVSMRYNNLCEYGPATAAALSLSQLLHDIDLSENALCQYAPATVKALATSPSIYIINLSANCLSEDGPATAEALVMLKSLHTIYMTNNDLEHYGSAIIKALSLSHSLHTIDVDNNNLSTRNLKSIDNITKQNIKSLQEFASKLMKLHPVSDVLRLSDLNLLKHWDKDLLTNFMEPYIGQAKAAELVSIYFSLDYFTNHAFKIMGVCKVLATDPNITEAGLYNMPPDIIFLINSFLSPEDYNLPDLDVVGNLEEAISNEICLLM